MSTRARVFLTIAILAGLLLRTVALEQMEYKEDEEYNFVWSQTVGHTQPWVFWGMPSGVYLPNPGMSVWVFAGLAKLAGAQDPVALMHALGVFAVLGILVCTLCALLSDRPRAWLWVGALGLVNPIHVLYERKLWPEGFLPFFVGLTLLQWWRRDRGFWPALLWGLIGALLGQIHMSGFFLAGALLLTTLAADSSRTRALPTWLAPWTLGSVLGALPLIPWAIHVWSLPAHPGVQQGLGEVLQFKFWVFLISNPWGLHVGNALGLLRGSSHLAQLGDFARYPLWDGHATWLVGLAHATLLAIIVALLARSIPKLRGAIARFHMPRSPEGILLVAVTLTMGALLTLPSISIRRYYLMVAFPIDTLLLVLWIRSIFPGWSDRLLSIIWVAQLVISSMLIVYVRANHGSPQGDYGRAFETEMKSRVPYGPPSSP